MEIKEAIKSLGFIVEAGFGKMYKNEAESIIKLLKRGKAYEAMWGKLKKQYGYHFLKILSHL